MKRPISEEAFAALCYLTIMTGGGGLEDKAPDYVAEKMIMLNAGEQAFTFLDSRNKVRLAAYLHNWNVEKPEIVHQYFNRL